MMKKHHTRQAFICSASALAIFASVNLAAAMPAVAQTQTVSDTDAIDQKAKTGTAIDETVVVVTARRKALENATEIKRRSDTVVDAVVADEAGKLPDTSVTEVLQRLPGVTMSRFASLGSPDQFSWEGSGVQVRGLSGVTSLLNGRESFSANGGGGLNWGDVTPELMSAVLVYKQSTSNIIEGGIGGTVDLRTHMPFDYKKPEVDMSASASYGDFSDKWSPSVSVLATRRFDTPIGEFGALVDLAYSQYYSSDSFMRVEPYYQTVYNGEKVYAPGGFTWGNDQFDRIRRGIYGAFQWRPNDNITFWQTDFVSRYHTLNRSEGVYPVDDKSETVIDGVFDADGIFQSGTLAAQTATSGFGVGSGNSKVVTKNQTVDISQGFDWHVTDRLQLRGALQIVDSYSDSTKQGLGIGSASPLRETFDLTGDLPVLGFDDASLAGMTAESTAKIANIIWYRSNNKAHMDSMNFDLSYEMNGKFFKQFQAGVRYATRRESDGFVGTGWSAAARGWNGSPQQTVASSPSEDFMLYEFPDFFKGQATAPSNYWFASESLLSAENLEHVLDYYANCSPTGARQCSSATSTTTLYADENFGLSPSMIKTRTQNQAIYGLLKFGHDGEGMGNFTGNIGLRIIRNSVQSDGVFTFTGGTTYYKTEADAAASLAEIGGIENLDAWQTAHPDEDLPYTYTSVSGTADRHEKFDYTRVLPAFNIAFKPDNAWILRVALTQTMTTPSYYDIRATGSGSVASLTNPYSTTDTYLPGIFNGYNYTSGNTRLKPAMSTNMDLSAEWYPSRSTNAHLTLFDKSIKDLIIYNSLDLDSTAAFGSVQPDSTDADGSSSVVTGSVIGAANYNAHGIATIKGFEFGGRTYFEKLPGVLRGLGIEANYTRIDSRSPDARATDMDGNLMTGVPVVGLSRDNFNVNLLYDLGKWDARLAYNWRSRYLATTTGNGTTGSYKINNLGDAVSYSLPVYGAASGQLDGSISYKVNDRMQLALNLTNIGDTIARTEMEILPGKFVTRSWFISDRRVSLSLKANF